ncbi:MAG: valine--tRNA ligase [Myxococcota bacterium]
MANKKQKVRAIDPLAIGKHFEAAAAEARWDETWERQGTYHYDPSRPRAETFVVDTPPPTVSGELHVGHVFSYTQTDVLVRYKRMRGFNIFYPMGWDDNGLPTERRVQNHFHIRCDPHLPYEPDLKLEEASAKQRKKPARLVSRPNFIEICEALTEIDEKIYRDLWHRIALSIDWRQEYTTIDDHCRRLAQLSFRDLFEKGLLYTTDAPTMWDVDLQTAVAQAETEDRVKAGAYHRIEFGVEGGEGSFTIATTRPELLAACVGVTAHPDDARYRDLFGKRAVTPLFRVSVPIFPSELADPEKGSGVLMVCTFGDATDVVWWREQELTLRQIVGRNGRLQQVEFGSEPFASLDPGAANRYYAELAGKSVEQAQRAIIELLRDPAGSAPGAAGGAPLQGEPEPIEHPIKYYEHGERPLEYIPTRQWFARLLERKADLLANGERIQWHPSFMFARYRDWTENLQLDWNLSRQRYFGVSIPVWYPLDTDGAPEYENPIVAESGRLPVDAMVDTPPGFEAAQRDQPGGFTGESDVFDTWFTSSLTPQISSHWQLDPERHARLFPADIRPQSHEIIRTWAFYTIAKALLHENELPWRHVLISGWILDPDRKKMSKSKGNVVTPIPAIEKYTADGVRYWAASARLGVDTAIDEKVFKVGKRLVTKIFNAGKFVLSQTAEVHPIGSELDRAFVAKIRGLVEDSTRAFEAFNYAQSLQLTESFFWTHFTDTYLELSKARARSEAPDDTGGRGSAVAALRLGLSVLLRLFAPVLPYISEEVWSWAFAAETGQPSIHRTPWPGADDFAGIEAPQEERSFDLAVAALAAINKCKADAAVSMGREVLGITLAANAATLERVKHVLDDVLAATRCQSHRLEERDGLEDDVFETADAEFAPKA